MSKSSVQLAGPLSREELRKENLGQRSQWLQAARELGQLAQSEKDPQHKADLLHDEQSMRAMAKIVDHKG